MTSYAQWFRLIEEHPRKLVPASSKNCREPPWQTDERYVINNPKQKRPSWKKTSLLKCKIANNWWDSRSIFEDLWQVEIYWTTWYVGALNWSLWLTENKFLCMKLCRSCFVLLIITFTYVTYIFLATVAFFLSAQNVAFHITNNYRIQWTSFAVTTATLYKSIYSQ